MNLVPIKQLESYNHLYTLGLTDQEIKTIKDTYGLFTATYKKKNIDFGANQQLTRRGQNEIIYYTGKVLGEQKMKLFLVCDSGNNFHLGFSTIQNRHSSIYVSREYYMDLPEGHTLLAAIPRVYVKDMPDPADLREMFSLSTTPGLTLRNQPLKVTTESLAKFKEFVRAQLLGKASIVSMLDTSDSFISSIKNLETLYKLPSTASDAYSSARKTITFPADYVTKIVAVLEIPQTAERLAILATPVKSRWSGETEIKWGAYIVNVNHALYNYTDIDRIVFYQGDSAPRFNHQYTLKVNGSLPSVVFTEDKPFLSPKVTFVQQFCDTKPRGAFPVLVNNEESQKLVATALRHQVREQRSTDRERARKKALSNRVTQLAPGKSFTLNGLKFAQDQISYEGQVFKTTAITTAKLFTNLLSALGENNVNYDNLIPAFLQYVCPSSQYIKTEKPVAMETTSTLGEVEVVYKAVSANNSNGSTTTRHFINGHRINREEVIKVIEQAPCFDTQANYDGFVAAVRKCSLKVHDYLVNGFDFTIKDDFQGKTLQLKIPLVRIDGKNFMDLKGHKHRVRGLAKIISTVQAYNSAKSYKYHSMSMTDFINLLGDEKTVGLTDYRVIGSLIAEAKEAFNVALEKSKELLTNTEKVLGLVLEEKNISGKYRTGYVIQGNSGKKYFVDSSDTAVSRYHSAKYPVFTYPEGHPICIVDKASSHKQVGKDALVNRLFALKNDSFVARKINTLKVA